jgi:hypothetical protein
VVQRDQGIRVHHTARWKRRDIRASNGDLVRGIPVGVGGEAGAKPTGANGARRPLAFRIFEMEI